VCAAVALSATSWAGGTLWQPGVALGPQLTVYVSQALWAGLATARRYGLRLEQIRAGANGAQRAEDGTIHRRDLIELQIAAHAGVRIEFGTRLTWDLGEESFSTSGAPARLVLNLPVRSPASLLAMNQHPSQPRTSHVPIVRLAPLDDIVAAAGRQQ